MRDHPVFEKSLYQDLVDLITRDAPEAWDELYVIGLNHDDVMKIETFSLHASETDWKKYDRGDFELYDWFENLVQVVADSERSELKSVKFSLDSTGKLKGKFGYDPVDALSHRDLRTEIEALSDEA